MSLLSRLGFAPTDPTPRQALLAAVRQRLQRLPPARAELVTAYAGLLARVVDADRAEPAEERAALPAQLAAFAGLAPDEAEAVVALVEHQRASVVGIDYSALTATVNAHATPEEKERLLHCLFAVAGADDEVSLEEDEEVRTVAAALMLSHAQFIAVRQRYKDKLAVLRYFKTERERG